MPAPGHTANTSGRAGGPELSSRDLGPLCLAVLQGRVSCPPAPAPGAPAAGAPCASSHTWLFTEQHGGSGPRAASRILGSLPLSFVPPASPLLPFPEQLLFIPQAPSGSPRLQDVLMPSLPPAGLLSCPLRSPAQPSPSRHQGCAPLRPRRSLLKEQRRQGGGSTGQPGTGPAWPPPAVSSRHPRVHAPLE